MSDTRGMQAPEATSPEDEFGIRLALASGCAVSEAALLSLVMRRHVAWDDASRLAACLIRRFGTARAVFGAQPGELSRIGGMTPGIVMDIVETGHLTRALQRSDQPKGSVIDGHDALIDYCRRNLAALEREELHVLLLDSGHAMIAHECLQKGTVNHVTVYPREVLSLAMRSGATGLVLVHNHPSGKARPSMADIAMTEAIRMAGHAVGLVLHDHVIVARDGEFSFRRQGLLRPDAGAAGMKTVPGLPALPGAPAEILLRTKPGSQNRVQHQGVSRIQGPGRRRRCRPEVPGGADHDTRPVQG